MAEEREIYLMPRITEAAFPELLELMVGEEDFPRTFREWTALWERRRLVEERDHGYDVVFIDVVPASLASYWIFRRIGEASDSTSQCWRGSERPIWLRATHR